MTALADRPSGPRDARQHAVHLAIVCLIVAMGTGLACRRAELSRPDPPGGKRITIAIPSADAPIGSLLFNLTRARLVRLDQSGLEQPALIERWTTSADRRTWTLTVREGVRLHDGQVANAADVTERISASIKAGEGGPGLWSVTSVEQSGPRDVRLRLAEPSSLLLETLSLEHAVPAGPFETSDEEASEPELRAVPQAGQPAAEIQRIQVRRYDTPRAAVAALLRDDVDVLYEVPNEARALLNAEEGVQVYPNVKPYVVTLGVNHRHPVLSRREVRLAMTMAIDREALIAQVAGGVGVPAADIIWHQHWTRPHDEDGKAIQLDRARAGRLLDQAGLPRRKNQEGGIAPRFSISCLVLDNPMMQRVAGRLQHAYADVGISLDLQAVPLRELPRRLETGQFDAFISPVVSGYGLSMPYLEFGAHDRPRMIDHGYRGAADAVERVRAAMTDDAFARAVRDLHHKLIEDPPAVYLFWQETSRAIGRRVVVPADSTGDVLGSLTRWTLQDHAP